MDIKKVGVIYRKEIKDILRDKRTIISMILIPLLMFPVIFGVIGYFMEGQVKKMEAKTHPIILLGSGNAPELAQALTGDTLFQVIETPMDMEAAKKLIEDDAVQAIVNIPDSFAVNLAAYLIGDGGEAPKVEVLFKKSKVEAEIASDKVINTIRQYREKIIADELVKRGIKADLTKPFVIESVNAATQEEMGGFMAGMLIPYIIIILALTGAMYPAIDLTAGEKERGTMETLLVAPVGRLEIVLGKFLVIMTASIATSALCLLSLSTSMSNGFMMMPDDAQFVLSPAGIAGVLVMMIPVAMLFSALLMALAVFARSYKEAQSYISPLMIFVILPAMLSNFPGVEISAGLAMIPIVNVSIMMRESLTGHFDFAMAGLSFLSTSVYAGIAIFTAFRLFQKESILFRS